ncbi:MAG TPA: type II CAAX endopeptidase family protein [Acidimicrobiia bacterium]|nr:type II CAAX endopeptidase family protein [Acidimicrobiia bacterium]
MDQPAASTLTPSGTTSRNGDGAHRSPVRDAWYRRLWRTYVTEVRADADAHASTTRATDRKMVVVFVTAALALTCGNFLSDGGQPQWLERILRTVRLPGLATRLHDGMLVSSHRDFNQLAFWAVVVITSYVLPAVIAIRFVLRERVMDYGLRVRGILPHGRTYAFLFAGAAPLIIAASFTASFQGRYPFFHPAAGSSLWPYMYAWWLLYWLQFCALEFFFRGFMLYGLAPRLGWAAIFAMALPYNMLHYGKPMPEALAAIVGAIVLGSLSLKTKSIWWGAALHISIALTMDLCALTHAGRVFG